MTVYAVMTVRQEADIINACLTHLRGQGVDRVLIYDGMSTDGTRDVYPEHDFVKVYDDTADHHRQPVLTSELACIAYDEGATWVLPVDADEFWIATNGARLDDVLNSQPADVSKLWVAMFQHHDRWNREVHAKPNPKVAFRAHAGARVTNGNHDCSTSTGREVRGVLELREIQYRGFDHFVRKVAERNATIDPSLNEGEGVHHRRLAGLDRAGLFAEWRRMQAVETVWDPIPCRP